ncbi:hypothetical protein NQ317_019501, partial [Molorchus minor]
ICTRSTLSISTTNTFSPWGAPYPSHSSPYPTGAPVNPTRLGIPSGTPMYMPQPMPMPSYPPTTMYMSNAGGSSHPPSSMPMPSPAGHPPATGGLPYPSSGGSAYPSSGGSPYPSSEDLHIPPLEGLLIPPPDLHCILLEDHLILLLPWSWCPPSGNQGHMYGGSKSPYGDYSRPPRSPQLSQGHGNHRTKRTPTVVPAQPFNPLS